jgi:para-aminobenzoate synthetase
MALELVSGGPSNSLKPTHRKPVPTTIILEHHDSYTRNLLALFSQLVDLDGAAWEKEGWKERVVVVNVDTISW